MVLYRRLPCWHCSCTPDLRFNTVLPIQIPLTNWKKNSWDSDLLGIYSHLVSFSHLEISCLTYVWHMFDICLTYASKIHRFLPALLPAPMTCRARSVHLHRISLGSIHRLGVGPQQWKKVVASLFFEGTMMTMEKWWKNDGKMMEKWWLTWCTLIRENHWISSENVSFLWEHGITWRNLAGIRRIFPCELEKSCDES